MELKLDENELNLAMSKGITNAVTQAIQSYDVNTILRNKVTSCVMNVAIEEVVNKAMMEVDMINLSKSIAKEFERAVVSLAVSSIRETMVKVVFDLRKGSRYMSQEEDKRLIEEIKRELEGKRDCK